MVCKRQNGFTLIEVVIVISVIGILAAVAIPRISQSIALMELDNAARQLASDLRLLEKLTLNNNDNGATLVPFITFKNSPPYGYQITGNTWVYFPNSVQINGNPSNINMSVYDGKPKSPIGITLESTVIPGAQRNIEIQFLTGRIRITN